MPHPGAVLITGASKGIGRASALFLERKGFRVFAGVRRDIDAKALRQEASERLTPIILDVAGDYHFARGDVKVSSTKQVSMGDVVYRKVPTLLLPINHSPPRAGRKMLEKYIVTICPKAGVVYFERFPE